MIPTKEVDETLELVGSGERMDATVQDSPAAVYYVQGGLRRPKSSRWLRHRSMPATT